MKSLALATLLLGLPLAGASAGGLPAGAAGATGRVVKIYGAGGLGGLEAYQTGLVISPEGHVLTTNSLVLDQGEVTVVLGTGQRYSGVVLGADPFVDVAVVKIDPAGDPLPAFKLRDPPEASPGQSVFVLANVFNIATGNEPVSVMRGVIAGRAPLRAQRGPLDRVDGGEVYLLDAVTSNPGAAGGAVVDRRGQLVGMLGRELKSRVTGVWFSYAIPTADLRTPVERILQGNASAGSASMDEEPPAVDLLDRFGFAIVPDIVPRTPPFVDAVRRASPAAQAGLRPDDLVVTVDGLVTGSAAELRRVVARVVARREAETPTPIRLFVQRGEEFVEIEVRAAEATPTEGLNP